MPNNVARRGRGSFNPNSRKASRQERRNNNNNSDNSGFDGKNTVQQKRSRTIPEQAMDEDIITDTAADAGVEVLASSPQENNTASTSLSSHPNMAAALSTPNDNASDGLNASMHARTMTPASPLTRHLIRLLVMILRLINSLFNLQPSPSTEMIFKLRLPPTLP
ncbi:hypothetical protein RclHR1_12880005 [Rhizophagus clarus]|uniref:Uncharacterized protein n=1 Tax=Rhizophagus clarus TaxID=94130 RepID=A0A2Z6QA28_9GLOM|nr:hypothetical protein RclHR1_12880005 [Rhizophagus clarus]GES79397.1 hypothetical protein GLOIN_2v1673942 [Rhizophagus clarus]